jgi:hypothetical protein
LPLGSSLVAILRLSRRNYPREGHSRSSTARTGRDSAGQFQHVRLTRGGAETLAAPPVRVPRRRSIVSSRPTTTGPAGTKARTSRARCRHPRQFATNSAGRHFTRRLSMPSAMDARASLPSGGPTPSPSGWRNPVGLPCLRVGLGRLPATRCGFRRLTTVSRSWAQPLGLRCECRDQRE